MSKRGKDKILGETNKFKSSFSSMTQGICHVYETKSLTLKVSCKFNAYTISNFSE